jgi:regulator of RNase E activity RraA
MLGWHNERRLRCGLGLHDPRPDDPYAGKGDPEKMKACQGNAPVDVIVWSGDGEAIYYFGELIAVGMQDRGSVGAPVDGGIHDTRWIGALGFPALESRRVAAKRLPARGNGEMGSRLAGRFHSRGLES